MKSARNMNLDTAISIASFVINSLNDDMGVAHWLEDYDDTLSIALEKWKKPCKRTLIHEYIETLFLESQNYMLRKHYPIGEIQEMQKIMENYDIDYSCVGYMDVKELTDDDCSTEEMELYAERLQSYFIDNGLNILVDDVFTILYTDKNFLYEFNKQCAEIIRKLKKSKHPELLKKDGVINRITYYPEWFKRGIRYRDKERCSLCGCDLSSAFTTIVDSNFDHIIPLKNGGNNDPSNWQLTCETCNKSKGARNSDFKNIVFPFWEIDDNR